MRIYILDNRTIWQRVVASNCVSLPRSVKFILHRNLTLLSFSSKFEVCLDKIIFNSKGISYICVMLAMHKNYHSVYCIYVSECMDHVSHLIVPAAFVTSR